MAAPAMESTVKALLAPAKASWRRTNVFRPMKHEFTIGDHVEWNSEAGRVRGTIKKKISAAIKLKTYTVRASKQEPQYLIKSDKTDHLAMHKSAVLKKIRETKKQ
jgi:hypothetical protein